MSATQQRPSKIGVLARGFTGRCGVCGNSLLNRSWLTVTPRCSRCDFPLERKEGHFVGGVGMNTIVTFGVILIGLLVSIAVTAGEPFPAGPVLLILGTIAALTSVVFYPISKTLWSAIDLLMVPLEKGEVDPRFDPHVSLGTNSDR